MERRKFLKVLGLGSVVAPLAAKTALENETMALTVSRSSALATGALTAAGGPMASSMEESAVRIKMSDHMKLFGIPQHVLQRITEESKWVYSLDFDIANKRSWSLAAKVHEQRQRQFQRKLEQVRNGGASEMARKAFAAAFGFNFLDW